MDEKSRRMGSLIVIGAEIIFCIFIYFLAGVSGGVNDYFVTQGVKSLPPLNMYITAIGFASAGILMLFSIWFKAAFHMLSLLTLAIFIYLFIFVYGLSYYGLIFALMPAAPYVFYLLFRMKAK